jgi:hypothetical protein
VPQSVAQITKEGAITLAAAMSLPEQHLIEGLRRLVPLILWGHAFMLIEKVNVLPERLCTWSGL